MSMGAPTQTNSSTDSHESKNADSLESKNTDSQESKEKPWAGLPADVDTSKQSMQMAMADMAEVERLLTAGVESQEFLPTELSQRLVSSGGKRIRPYLMCLCFRSLNNGKVQGRASLNELYTLAAVAEWVHTATLFHDDVLDFSPTRRDAAAAHMTHGNKNAILVGDFVYAEAFYLLMKNGLLEPSRNLAQTIKTVVEGELRQHRVAMERDLGFDNYERIARAKTAALFAWCTETGAWAAGSQHFTEAWRFGDALGYAFQMADDLIDTFELNAATANELDLQQWLEGAAPLPLVLLAEKSATLPEEAKAVKDLWSRALDSSDLDVRRDLVLKLQNLSRREDIISESLERVDRELESASTNLRTLKAIDGLHWALDAIWERGIEGAKLSGCFKDGASSATPRFRRLPAGETE